ncbi:glutaredoxin [Paenibacillus sp. MMO-58]|uniref:glutaredoxin n=1 Tax=Paenibacillus sp. MMO-58 TaxID=3081290 RepID=UPI0030196C61
MAKIEVFTAGTFLCEEMIMQVKDLACSNCEIVIYELNKSNAIMESVDKARLYRISSIPTLVINGKIIDYEAAKRARLNKQSS